MFSDGTLQLLPYRIAASAPSRKPPTSSFANPARITGKIGTPLPIRFKESKTLSATTVTSGYTERVGETLRATRNTRCDVRALRYRLFFLAILVGGLAALPVSAQTSSKKDPVSTGATKLPSGAIIVIAKDQTRSTKPDAIYLSPEKFKELNDQIEALKKQVAARRRCRRIPANSPVVSKSAARKRSSGSRPHSNFAR